MEYVVAGVYEYFIPLKVTFAARMLPEDVTVALSVAVWLGFSAQINVAVQVVLLFDQIQMGRLDSTQVTVQTFL